MTKARDISKLLSTANGKIAGANLDVSFENITDTGTEGTRVATGTTAQRGSTAGQLRFNSQTGLAEYYDGSQFKAIDAPPTVSSIDVTEVDSQAGGNQTIVITGGNFQSGATVTFVGASGTDFNASTVTVDSATQITAVAPKASFLNAQEPYGVKVENTSSLSGTLASQINVDTSPSWSTASGSLGNVFEGDTANLSVSATDPDGDTVAYSETGGTVLSTNGLSINSSTGAITGTAGTVSGDTTINFDLRATANSKNAVRSFSILIKDSLETNANTLAFFDFASGRSYDGTSTLQDLSGNNKDLPIGGGSFSSNNSGTITTSNVQNIRSTGLTGSISEISMGLWVKLSGNTNDGVIYYGDTSTNNHFFIRDGVNAGAYNFDVGKDISSSDTWTKSKYNGSDMANYITGVSGYASKFWYYVVRINSSGVVTCSLNKSTFETVVNAGVNMSGHSSGQFGLAGDPYNDNPSSHTYGVAWWYNGVISQELSDSIYNKYASRFGY
jgi:hypothetical protein